MVRGTSSVNIWGRAFQAEGEASAKTLRQEKAWRAPEPDRLGSGERVGEQGKTRSRRELEARAAGPCEVTGWM